MLLKLITSIHNGEHSQEKHGRGPCRWWGSCGSKTLHWLPPSQRWYRYILVEGRLRSTPLWLPRSTGRKSDVARSSSSGASDLGPWNAHYHRDGAGSPPPLPWRHSGSEMGVKFKVIFIWLVTVDFCYGELN